METFNSYNESVDDPFKSMRLSKNDYSWIQIRDILQEFRGVVKTVAN